LGRKFLGIDLEEEFLRLGQRRKIAIQTPTTKQQFLRRLAGFNNVDLPSVLSQELP
jgi:hypothetical protein